MRRALLLSMSLATDRITRSIRMSLISSRLSFVLSKCSLHTTSLRRTPSASLHRPLHVNSSTFSSGIVPSNKTTYPLSQIQTALKAQTGSLPYVGCGSNGTVLQEVWYYNHVLGTVSDTPVRPSSLSIAYRLLQLHRSNLGSSRAWTRPIIALALLQLVFIITRGHPRPSVRCGEAWSVGGEEVPIMWARCGCESRFPLLQYYLLIKALFCEQ